MMKCIKTSNGFTLIELLIAVAIFGIVVAGIVTSKIRQQDQTITQQQAVEMQQTARAVLFLMSRQLRSAGYNPTYDNIDTGITVANETSLTFNRVENDDGLDNDGDGATDEDDELVTINYTLQDEDADGDLDISANGVIMAENIQSLLFTYFDADGVDLIPPGAASVADPTLIRSVQITIMDRTDINQLSRAANNNNTRSLSTSVYVRNMGF